MFSSSPLSNAIIISVFFHGIVLFLMPHSSFLKKDAPQKNVEIFYLNKPDTKRIFSSKSPADNKKYEALRKLPPVDIAEKKNQVFPIDKQASKSRENALKAALLTKSYLMKPEIVSLKKKISFLSVDKDKVHTPTYTSYYQVVREKIKHAAYQRYSRTEMGEVYLSFVISSDGDLKQTRIVDEKSSFSPYLREIALKSVKNAAPFPKFPKELDYPQLSFNVIVSFEME